MTHHLISQATTSHQDSAEVTIYDWCIMGLQSGFRCSEWCQSHSRKSLLLTTAVNKNIDGSSTVFIAADFALKNKYSCQLIATHVLDPTKLVYCSTYWRYQNNGDNGQVITYIRKMDNPEIFMSLSSFVY